MTVTQILDEARNNLNAAADSLWADAELYVKLYKVMLRFARKTRCIQATDSSTTTVIGTAAYSVPAAAFEIYRVEYNGAKLSVMDRRQYDTLNPSSTTSSGTPAFYMLEGTSVTLYPTPGDTKTLKFYSYNIPAAVPTGATTLEVPVAYHDGLCDGLTAEMCAKDVGNPLTLYWQGRWKDALSEAEALEKMKKRRDRFAVVKVEEQSLNNDLGLI